MNAEFVELLRQGGLLAVIAIETCAVIALWRRYVDSQEARIAEVERITEVISTNTRLVEALERALMQRGGRR